ncbi:MAG TPA: efflux transporter periplasmic adaptor subunit, partial [Burkholderiaceae bacterium]
MTTDIKNKKSALAIAAVLVVGLVLGAAILRTDKVQPAGEDHGHAEAGHAEEGHGDKGHDKEGHSDSDHHA